MLFQNLYENILVCKKLKTKQENHFINSIEDIQNLVLQGFLKKKKIVVLQTNSSRNCKLEIYYTPRP